ncbi:MAG: DUF4149 domain-containing protein [Hyphomicrobiaceae bacterium]
MPELAAILTSASVGAMLFFSSVIAPTVFQVIPEEQAGSVLRAVFPRYFLISGSAAVAAGLIAMERTGLITTDRLRFRYACHSLRSNTRYQ